MTEAWKVFTNDLRPPIRGGDPVWDGALPHALPVVVVDESADECAAGWNACADAATALRIAGLWPNGRPSRLFHVETDARVLARGDKLRAATWTITREATDAEVREAIHAMSAPFGDLRDAMVAEQIAWRHAFGRPKRDAAVVESSLRETLGARSLNWELRQFPAARDARDTRDTRDARAAWAAWDARDARAAWAAWDAWAAWAAWDAWAAWAAWDAWAAWAAWAARDAMSVFYAASRGWIDLRPDKLTVGLRTAYEHGLGIALPVENGVFGWAMGEAQQ